MRQTDAIGLIARELARELRAFAHDRRDEQKKRIAQLHTQLCQAYNKEEEEVD